MMLNFNEIWKDIKGYEGLYQVSNLGRVKSIEKYFLRKYKNTIRPYSKPSKILKPFPTRTGYLLVKLTKEKKEKSFQVHRLVAITFIPNPENKPQVNHINGVKTDNYITNLEWVTAKENTRHKYDVLGFKFSEEIKEKMRIKKIGTSLDSRVREKISNANKGRKSVNIKKVKCIDTGIIFNSAQEASLFLGLTRCAVSKSIKRKTRAGGFFWKYVN